MKFIKKTDVYIILTVTVIAFAVYVGMTRTNEPLKAIISVNGETYREVNLTGNEEYYEIKPGTENNVVIAVNGETIYFKESDCPDKICVKSGKLTKRGDTAACLPAGIVITILGSDVDAVTY